MNYWDKLAPDNRRRHAMLLVRAQAEDAAGTAEVW
jgi:hypothetical protein